MSGTLGDAFIVILKLYNPYKNKKIYLKRISRWTDQDQVIRNLTKLFSFIEYKKPCIEISSVDQTINTIENLDFKYVNTSWNGSHFNKSEKDFSKLSVEPFPKIKIKKKRKKNSKILVCIQVNSGKIGGNCKIFSSKWLFELIMLFDPDKFEIILLGTTVNNKFFSKNNFSIFNNLKILVDKTSFIEWLKIINRSDFFISNEGFPAFFSMSQKIKTICFYTDKRILTRMHPFWRKDNLVLDVGWKSFYSTLNVIVARILYKRYPYIYPIKPKNIYNYIINNIKQSEKNLYFKTKNL